MDILFFHHFQLSILWNVNCVQVAARLHFGGSSSPPYLFYRTDGSHWGGYPVELRRLRYVPLDAPAVRPRRQIFKE